MNKNRTYKKHRWKTEDDMTDFVQDVAAMASVSAFLITMALWIGAI